MALCVTYFNTARAARAVAARQPVFRTGERQSSGEEGALRMATAQIRQRASTAGVVPGVPRRASGGSGGVQLKFEREHS